MAGHPHGAKLAAYHSVSAHGGVAAADPHRLIALLLDGALERIAGARGCIERKDYAGKAHLIGRAIQIVDELRSSLDMSAGAQIATNLSVLYDFMSLRLLKASAENRIEHLDEVSRLLQEIRKAWTAIPPGAREAHATAK